jgi:long-chain acyl-CoA synthetase
MTRGIADIFKEVIILNSGRLIYAEDIEEFYTKVAPIKEMCVFTVTGMKGVSESKVLWAVIQPDLESFRKFAVVNLHLAIKERFDETSLALPVYKRLKGFTITLADLPHTLLGKLDRYAVKEVYEPRVIAGIEGALPVLGELTAEDRLLIESEIGVKVLKCLKEISGIKRSIILEDSLELDLSIDSLGRIELASCLQLAFSADIKDEAISRAFSVKHLILGIIDALREAKGIRPQEDQSVPLLSGYWKKHLGVLPKEEHLGALEFNNGFFAWSFRFIIIAINYVNFKLFFKVKAEGAQNVPAAGAYILYPNHTSDLDGPAIAACLRAGRLFSFFISSLYRFFSGLLSNPHF